MRPHTGTCFRLPSEAGKPARLEEAGVTLITGKTIQIARATLATVRLKEAIGSE